MYLSLKAIVEGLGGKKRADVESTGDRLANIPPEAFDKMQREAVAAITAKAGSRLPVMVGKDPGLPKAAPVFDIDEMRRRNAEISRKRALAKQKADKSDVGL